MRFEDIRLECEILSPVHIGTGEEIAAYDYFIQSGLLIKINLNKVIDSLSENELAQFNQINESGNFIGLRRFLIKKSNDRTWLTGVTEFTIPVSSEIEKKYNENIDNPANQLLIQLNQRTRISNNPILPGSSIKGAIRTAVLNKLGTKFDHLPGNSRKAEGILLNAFNKKTGNFQVEWDPFKYFKIGDVQLNQGDSYICAVKNVSKDGQNRLKTNEMQMIHEVFNSTLVDKSLKFEIVIKIGKMQAGNEILDKRFIFNSCKGFYNHKLSTTNFDYFQGTEIEDYIVKIMKQVNSSDEFLIRVGRFSGKESITLDKHRTGKLAATRNLAEGKYPMGWIKCKVMN